MDTNFTLTLWTNNPKLAMLADQCGINRIGVDLETIGKHKRQENKNTWISNHTIDDIYRIKEKIKSAKLFARTNPIHPGSTDEINQLIEAGVKTLMLPYFTTFHEAERFIRIVDQRAEVCLLVEHIKAVRIINDLIKLDNVNEIFLGLNDLSLSLNKPLKSRFQILIEPLIQTISDKVNNAEINFGFGGLARVGDTSMPIKPDLIYAQYARLNANSALISQSFIQNLPLHKDKIQLEIDSARKRLNFWLTSNRKAVLQAHQSLANYFSSA